MRCIANVRDESHTQLAVWKQCEHEGTDLLGDQWFCGYHGEAIRRDVLGEGYVYFATSDRHPGLLKIGWTRDPVGRARSLRARIVAMQHGTRRDEANLHLTFAVNRVRGEWFQAEEELLDYIKRLPPLVVPQEVAA